MGILLHFWYFYCITTTSVKNLWRSDTNAMQILSLCLKVKRFLLVKSPPILLLTFLSTVRLHPGCTFL